VRDFFVKSLEMIVNAIVVLGAIGLHQKTRRSADALEKMAQR